MILKYINFKDFRQYKDEQKVVFSTDAEKNVTVILGENTSGKTTMVQALSWLFYDDNRFEDEILVNKALIEEVEAYDDISAEVEARIAHNSKEYIIKRKQIYTKNDFDKVTKRGNSVVTMLEIDDKGNSSPVDQSEINEKINSIIPEDLSTYFFFTGEKIKDVTTKKNLSEAVKRLMGLDALINTKNHLDIESSRSVYRAFAKEMENDNADEVNELNEIIDTCEKQIEEYKENCNSFEKELDKYNERRNGLLIRLRDYDAINSKQQQVDEYTKTVNRYKSLLEDSEKDIKNSFSEKIYNVFAKSFASKAIEILDSANSNVDIEALPSVNSKTIDAILKRRKCLCGREFEEGDDTYRCLLESKDYYPPKSIGTCVSEFKHDLMKYSGNTEDYYSTFEKNYKKRIELMADISEMERKIETLNSEIIGFDKVKDDKEQLDETDSKIAELNQKIGSCNNNIERCKNKIAECENKKSKFVVATDKNKEIQVRMDYAKKLYEYFNDAFNKKEKDIHKNLSDTVNGYFSKMYHESKSLLLDDDYNIILHARIGDKNIETENSNGEKAVKNFAFVCGLANVAKNKLGAKLEELSSDIDNNLEPYPLIMDAPFSDLDETHVHNISSILPEASDQVIMVVMRKDWKYARDVLIDKIGKAYVLDKKSPTLTFIEEVESV